MSTQTARLRKYGKKPQVASTISCVFLDVSTPEKTSRKSSSTALRETSGNSQRRLSRSPTKITEAEKFSNRLANETIVEKAEAEDTTATKAKSDCHNFEALSTKIACLELDAESISTKEPLESISTAPSIEVHHHPAGISKQTEAYLEPLLQCNHVSKVVESFQGWMDERDGLLSTKKIGEGSFGEVYRAECSAEEAVILKLMPLNAQRGIGARSFTSIKAARNEVQLLSRMSKVPGFVEFRGACILQGTMPTQLINAWDTYCESGRTVESRNPHKKDSYPASQLWVLIEMSDAGHSLEPGRYAPPGCSSIKPTESSAYLPIRHTWDIFWQIVKALAKGEVFANYEHRDLHLGNICVKDIDEPVKAKNEDQGVFGINRAGVEVTLIDYSLSRASVSSNETLCYDFKNDKALLKGQGDLQYDMYRHMAALVGRQSSKAFVPQTNVLWLWYVLKRLLAGTHGTVDGSDSESDVINYSELHDILNELQLALDPAKRDEWPWYSAGHLLEEGVERNWFLASEITDL